MKSLLLAALLALPCFGQSPSKCAVNIDKLPPLEGVQLRMSETEVRSLPVVEIPSTSHVGVRIFDSVEDGDTMPPSWISVRTYDQKVASFWVFYGNNDVSKDPDAFVKELSRILGLPRDAWTPTRYGSSIACRDFSVSITFTNNFLVVGDEVAKRKLIADTKAELLRRSKP